MAGDRLLRGRIGRDSNCLRLHNNLAFGFVELSGQISVVDLPVAPHGRV